MNVRKKNKSCAVMALAICLLAGCSSNTNANSRQAGAAGIKDILESMAPETTPVMTKAVTPETTKASEETKKETAEETKASSQETVYEKVDVDLTSLSSTMVYSEVYNIVAGPDDYIGKVIKMKGALATYHDETTGKDYFACIIKDATACCSQGIEFIRSGSPSYPEDYPALGTEVVVTGVFDVYWEGDNKYCTLRDALMTKE